MHLNWHGANAADTCSYKAHVPCVYAMWKGVTSRRIKSSAYEPTQSQLLRALDYWRTTGVLLAYNLIDAKILLVSNS